MRIISFIEELDVIEKYYAILTFGISATMTLLRIPNWISPVGCTMEQDRFVSIAADKRPVAIAILTSL